jgi:hypothetical protein
MPIEQKEVSIDGDVYRISQLPYRKGQKLMVRLFKALGPAISSAAGSGLEETDPKQDLGEADVNLANTLSAGVQRLADSLNEEDFDFVVDTLSSHTELKRGENQWVNLKDVMEIHFSGRHFHSMKWMFECLKFNYSDFLDGRGAFENLASKIKAVS